MKYHKIIKLKDGRVCILRNGEESDGQAVLINFILTHEQTDYLLSYPDENTMTADEPMTCVAVGTGKYVEFLSGKHFED